MLTVKQTDVLKTTEKLSRELIEAVRTGNTSHVRQLLARGIHPDTPDPEGRVALREAAAGNHYHIAFELLNRGAAVDAVNYAGRTPLMTACSCGNGEMVSLLLFYGADANVADAEGMAGMTITTTTIMITAMMTADLSTTGSIVNTAQTPQGANAKNARHQSLVNSISAPIAALLFRVSQNADHAETNLSQMQNFVRHAGLKRDYCVAR